MKKKCFLNIICFLLISSLSTYAQDCGFDDNESLSDSKKKLEWFVKKLTNQDLVITNDKNDIPFNVKKQLDCYTNGFDIANPDEDYQDGCIVEEGVPSRELTLLAKNENYLIISYNTYALGSSGHHIWIKYNYKGILDFWSTSTMAKPLLASRFQLKKYFEQTESFAKDWYRYVENNN